MDGFAVGLTAFSTHIHWNRCIFGQQVRQQSMINRGCLQDYRMLNGWSMVVAGPGHTDVPRHIRRYAKWLTCDRYIWDMAKASRFPSNG